MTLILASALCAVIVILGLMIPSSGESSPGKRWTFIGSIGEKPWVGSEGRTSEGIKWTFNGYLWKRGPFRLIKLTTSSMGSRVKKHKLKEQATGVAWLDKDFQIVGYQPRRSKRNNRERCRKLNLSIGFTWKGANIGAGTQFVHCAEQKTYTETRGNLARIGYPLHYDGFEVRSEFEGSGIRGSTRGANTGWVMLREKRRPKGTFRWYSTICKSSYRYQQPIWIEYDYKQC